MSISRCLAALSEQTEICIGMLPWEEDTFKIIFHKGNLNLSNDVNVTTILALWKMVAQLLLNIKHSFWLLCHVHCLYLFT